MKKRLLIITIVIAMIAALTGCGSSQPAETAQQTQEGYPVTITDHAGREVTIEKQPESIVSGYYIATSMLIGLGQADRLSGVENTPEKRPVYGMSAPDILDLPTLGTVKEFDLEKCAEINPDLVVLPYKLKDITPSLDQLGIPVIVIEPETQQLLAESIQILGQATGSSDTAEEMQQYIDGQLAEAERCLQGLERPSVYLGGNSSILQTAGPAMYQDALIANAGGSNVAAELTDTYWAEVSYEQILAWDPEYIILAADAEYTVDDVLTDPVLADCTAVKKGNVYHIPDNIESWDSPVPASFLGSLWMASVLHPEDYHVKQYEAAAVEFYDAFYGVTPEVE